MPMQVLRPPINLDPRMSAPACTCAYVPTRFFPAVQLHTPGDAVRNALSPSGGIGHGVLSARRARDRTPDGRKRMGRWWPPRTSNPVGRRKRLRWVRFPHASASLFPMEARGIEASRAPTSSPCTGNHEGVPAWRRGEQKTQRIFHDSTRAGPQIASGRPRANVGIPSRFRHASSQWKPGESKREARRRSLLRREAPRSHPTARLSGCSQRSCPACVSQSSYRILHLAESPGLTIPGPPPFPYLRSPFGGPPCSVCSTCPRGGSFRIEYRHPQ